MATIDRALPLGLKLREVLAWIGVVAEGDGRHDVAAECRALHDDIGDVEIDAMVPLLHLLCQGVGFLRDRGEAGCAGRIDEIIRLLKRDTAPRVVVGSIDFRGATPSDVEAAFERASRLVTARR